jgi:tripartite-type tricarboxylate transporter receptor subunit TctC
MFCHVIRGALLAAAVIAAPMAAQAQQDYPNQPIKLVVPFPPGGGTDLSGRVAAEYLTQKLGQNVVVENRAGAATQVGMDFVAKAKPDGYTLLWTTSDGMSMLPAVKPTVPFKIPESYEWVAGAAT